MKTYDLMIIGSGPAAQVVSSRVRAAGWSVALVDHRPFGGTCALRGCDPKKMLISGAEAIDAVARMSGHGVKGEARIDWRDLMMFKRSFTDAVPRNREKDFAESGIDAFHELARFADSDVVIIDGRQLKARYFLIAAGARPVPLNIPGQEHAITSEEFLELDRLPARIDDCHHEGRSGWAWVARPGGRTELTGSAADMPRSLVPITCTSRKCRHPMATR
jgi:glutathione reductase (NADPH)